MAARPGTPVELLEDLFSIMVVNECVQEYVEDLEEQKEANQMGGEEALLLEVLRRRITACDFAATSRFLPVGRDQPSPSEDAQSNEARENQPPGPPIHGASVVQSGPEADANSNASESTGGSLDSRWYTMGLTRAEWVDAIKEVPGASHLPPGSEARKQHEVALSSKLRTMVWAGVRTKLEQRLLQLETIADRYLSHGSITSQAQEMAIDLPSKVRQLKAFARQNQQQLLAVKLDTLQAATTFLQELQGACQAFQGLLQYRLSDQSRMDQADSAKLGGFIDEAFSGMSLLEMTVRAETYDAQVVAALKKVRSLIDERKQEQQRLLLEKKERLRRLQGNSRFMDIAREIKRKQEIIDKLKARRASDNSVQDTPLETPLHDYGNRGRMRNSIPDTPDTKPLSFRLRY